MKQDDIRDEITKYVQALETNYTDTIKELRSAIDKERLKTKKVQADRVNENTEKNELEGLFVDCIEEVRKDIMKRRLKNEIYNKKKFQQIEKNTEEAREFEESLLRLAQLAKNRVKMSDFTVRDKCNLLDLFVNNEKTLLKIYEALFPHRTTNQGADKLGANLNQNKERQITLRNSQISNHLAQAVNHHAEDPYSSNQSSIMLGGQTNLPMIAGGGSQPRQDFNSFRSSLMNSQGVDALTQNIAMRHQAAGGNF